MDLEKVVEKLSRYKLRDFVQRMNSGITPKVTEYDGYYTDADKGIPFLRVQNLSPEGLCLSDCKYINEKTHSGILKRSQVFQGDLLIKITGVGRMAITSIAPEGFEGNINQHIVAVKTKNSKINEQIAAFLNSDVGEMLASHRATGGTRPALDYAALRSIPIILNDEIVDIMKRAYSKKIQLENEAQTLVESIDTYLLQELGVAISSESEDLHNNRIFYICSDNILETRFDPYYHKPIFDMNIKHIENGKNPVIDLKETMEDGLIKGIFPNEGQKGGECKVIQISNINTDGTIQIEGNITSQPIYEEKQKLRKGDILIVITGATIGKIGYWDYEGEYYLGGDIVKFNTGNSNLNEIYAALLRTSPYQLQMKRCITGATNGHLALKDIEQLLLPNIIDAKLQETIAIQLESSRKKIQLLKREAREVVRLAKLEVAKILLGDSL